MKIFLIILLFMGGLFIMSNKTEAYGSAALEGKEIILKSEYTSLNVGLKSPEFVINDEKINSMVPKNMKGSLEKGLEVSYDTASLSNGGKLEVILYIRWYEKESVLRKYATYKYTGKETIGVKDIVLDRIDLGYLPYHNPSPPQSIPVFGKGVFLGIEFPVSDTKIEGNTVILGHKPGKYIHNGESLNTKTAIYGLIPEGKEREYFIEYIKNNRPFKNSLHFNYNSWWTSPVPFNEEDILNLMGEFENNLYIKNGVDLDSFSIDLGWSKKDDVWVIDKNMFEYEFETIDKKARSMKSNLGLWISPSNFYSPASFDNSTAEKLGYETLNIPWGEGEVKLCCLAGDKYKKRFKETLTYVTEKYGVKQFKLDGCFLYCKETGHGHMPAEYSSESIADTMIDVCASIHKISPDAWIEPTCFGFNPSPWWLNYTNSLIGCYGDDSPPGAVPAPVYRESATTGRDMYNLQGAYYLAMPINAQEVLGIVHQTNEPFMNDAVMGVMRGHAFVPLYVNPKYMNDARWTQLASLMKWARKNENILKNTKPIEPEAWRKNGVPTLKGVQEMPKDIYGYAHWNDSKNKSITVLRNPSMFKQSINLSLKDDLNLKEDYYSITSIYPESRLYENKVKDNFSIELAPYETLVVCAEKDKVSDLPKAKHDYFVAKSAKLSPLKIVYKDENTMGDNWTSTIGKANTLIEYPIEAVIENISNNADLLICLEGQTGVLSPSSEIKINGKKVNYEIISSGSGWISTVITYAEKWNFICIPLEKGRNVISGIIRIPVIEDETILSISAIAKKMGSVNKNTDNLAEPEIIYLDGITLMEPIDISKLELETVFKEEKPIKTIDGIFLDRLTPDFAEVGWGKLEYNKTVLEKDISIGGRVFARGLGTHAPSLIRYNIDGKYKRFQCYLGCDDENNATVKFVIKGDGKILWESGYYTKDKGAAFVDLDIAGVKVFELISTDGGNDYHGDHIDYADACFLN